MPEATGEPNGPAALLRVDVEYRGRASTYWVNQEAVKVPSMWHLYANAEDLLAALSDLRAQNSPTEGSLIQRVSRHARTVAAEPALAAHVHGLLI